MTARRPSPKSVSIFFKTLSAALAGFLLLSTPLLTPVFKTKTLAAPAAAENKEQPYTAPNFVQVHLLFYFNELSCYALCTLNSGSRTLALQLLPQTAVLKSKTVFSAERPLQSAKLFFGCTASYFVPLNNGELTALVNACGGVAANAQSLPAVTGAGRLPGGTVNLYGAQWLKLLLQNSEATVEGLNARALLLGNLLLQCCNAPEQVPLQLLLKANSSLSKADLLKFKQQFKAPLQSGGFGVLNGVFMGNSYYLQ